MVARAVMLFMNCCLYFFLNDSATTEIYTLSLHDALPISAARGGRARRARPAGVGPLRGPPRARRGARRRADRKSTRLNSSHMSISYAVFCLKKKKHSTKITTLSVMLFVAWRLTFDNNALC